VTLPDGWIMELPGYATDHGRTKRERDQSHVLAYCDARGGVLKTHGRVPHEVVSACMLAAKDWPAEFKA
jgi:hypothetical protein